MSLSRCSSSSPACRPRRTPDELNKVLLSSGALFLSPVLPPVDSFSAFTPCQLPISHPSSIDTTFLQALFPQPIPNYPFVTIILIPILLHISPFSSLPDSTSSNPFPFLSPSFPLPFPFLSPSFPLPFPLLSPSILIRTSIYTQSLSPLFSFPLGSGSNLVSFPFHPFLIR